jgi:hypothetical protein
LCHVDNIEGYIFTIARNKKNKPNSGLLIIIAQLTPAIAYSSESGHRGFYFYNNILVGKEAVIIGRQTNSLYLGSDWYGLSKNSWL